MRNTNAIASTSTHASNTINEVIHQILQLLVTVSAETSFSSSVGQNSRLAFCGAAADVVLLDMHKAVEQIICWYDVKYAHSIRVIFPAAETSPVEV